MHNVFIITSVTMLKKIVVWYINGVLHESMNATLKCSS